MVVGGGGGEKARQHFCSLHEQFLLTGGRGAVELWCVRLCAVALLPLSGGAVRAHSYASGACENRGVLL